MDHRKLDKSKQQREWYSNLERMRDQLLSLVLSENAPYKNASHAKPTRAAISLLMVMAD